MDKGGRGVPRPHTGLPLVYTTDRHATRTVSSACSIRNSTSHCISSGIPARRDVAASLRRSSVSSLRTVLSERAVDSGTASEHSSQDARNSCCQSINHVYFRHNSPYDRKTDRIGKFKKRKDIRTHNAVPDHIVS